MSKNPKARKAVPTSEELYDMLKLRYPAPSWALLPQVANGTGAQAYRWADGVAVCCWPSLGHEVHGFEIKVARYDFLNELKDGGKSNEIFQYCDRWWLVAAHEDVVGTAELPPTWGLMVPKRKHLHAVKAAPKLKPKKPDIGFVASILRNAMEIVVPDASLKEARKAGYDEGLKEGKESRRYRERSIKGEYDALQASIKAFEKTIGHPWPYVNEYTTTFKDHERLAEAIKLMMKGEYGNIRKQFERLLENAKDIVERVEKHLDGEKSGS